VIFHPKNPETGKENVQMWQFASYPAIRGEANMLAFVQESKKVQDEVLAGCYEYKDAAVALDAAGVVIEDGAVTVDLGD
jgi:hypothetical protein